MVTRQTMQSLKREHFPSREVNTALQGKCTYYGWLLEDEQLMQRITLNTQIL